MPALVKNEMSCRFQYSAGKSNHAMSGGSAGGDCPCVGLKLKAGDSVATSWGRKEFSFLTTCPRLCFPSPWHWQPALKQTRSSLQEVAPGVHPQFSPIPPFSAHGTLVPSSVEQSFAKWSTRILLRHIFLASYPRASDSRGLGWGPEFAFVMSFQVILKLLAHGLLIGGANRLTRESQPATRGWATTCYSLRTLTRQPFGNADVVLTALLVVVVTERIALVTSN